MARILGVDIPNNKHVVISLTYIYGIGNDSAQKILDKLGIDHRKKNKRSNRRTTFYSCN